MHCLFTASLPILRFFSCFFSCLFTVLCVCVENDLAQSFSSLVFSSLLLLFSSLLFSALLLPFLLFSSYHFTILFCSLLFSTLLFSSLLFCKRVPLPAMTEQGEPAPFNGIPFATGLVGYLPPTYSEAAADRSRWKGGTSPNLYRLSPSEGTRSL
jgi:hypothetical protein